MTHQETLFGGVAGNQFENWWRAFPNVRKHAKGAARKAWTKATTKESWTGYEAVMAALEKAKRSKQWKDGYVPMPATWLNQERWLDEWPEDDPSAPSSRSASAAAKRVLR